MSSNGAFDRAEPRSTVSPPPAEVSEHPLRARVAELEAQLSARVHELAEQRRFMERVVDSLPVGLYVVDRGDRMQARNRKRETRLQGISRKRALGRTIFDVLHRQPAAVLKREVAERFASGRMSQFQMERRATGDARTHRLCTIPMRPDDQQPRLVTQVITIGEDITDWRTARDRCLFRQTLFMLPHHPRGKLVSVVTELESSGPFVVRGDADLPARVFEPFFSTKAPGRDIGGGLSICYGLVMEHGGVLSVDTLAGQGSTFRMVLPADGASPITAGGGIPRRSHVPLGAMA